MVAKVPIAAAIEGLRSELGEALASGSGERIRFEPGEIEVEFQAVVTLGAEGGAKAKWWVPVDLEAKGKAERVTTQRIRMSLKPIVMDGDKPAGTQLLDGDDAPAASGRTASGGLDAADA